jgi:hypothetical protein
VIQKHRTELIRRSKIKQIGVGYKISDGRITDKIGVVVFVTKKPSEKQLRAQQIEPIPKRIDGIVTDVIEVPGGFKPRSPDDKRYRPFRGGVATINVRSSGTGTLGIVLRRVGSSSKLYALTNNHVGANEDVKGMLPPAAKKGDAWIQPGAHGNGKVPQDLIAKLYKWNRLKPSAPNAVNHYDVAVGEIVPASIQDAKPYEILNIGKVEGMDDIRLNDKVMKRGRTTRKTIGRVIAVMQSVQVEYNGYPCDFEGQVAIVGDPPSKPFSLAGDSGSLVVSKEKNSSNNAYEARALLFAGGQSSEGIDITIASPIKKVAKDFKLEF